MIKAMSPGQSGHPPHAGGHFCILDVGLEYKMGYPAPSTSLDSGLHHLAGDRAPVRFGFVVSFAFAPVFAVWQTDFYQDFAVGF